MLKVFVLLYLIKQWNNSSCAPPLPNCAFVHVVLLLCVLAELLGFTLIMTLSASSSEQDLDILFEDWITYTHYALRSLKPTI